MFVNALYAIVLLVRLSNVKCDVSSLGVGGYSYPQVQPPFIQFDEPSTPSSIYLPQAPPIFQEEDIFPPLQLPPSPVSTYLPPDIYPPIGTPPDIFNDFDTVSIPAAPTPGTLYQTPIPKMRVLHMSCILNNSFKSTIQLEGRSSFQLPPVIEDASTRCITPISSGTFAINMVGTKQMAQCGVKRCASGASSRTNMCVVVRMPTIQGLKLPEDGLVTLQCTPQESVVSHTKHLRLGPTAVSKGRSGGSGLVASGGGSKTFSSNMILLRKSPGSNNFDQPLQTGSVVLLGEEIVLKASVQDGDGWKFSRIGPVVIKSTNSQRSLNLVEENGCRSPGIKTICPFQPRQLTSLDNVLHFRAFLFQDSARGDDMVLSVKMIGCLNAQDCFQVGACDSSNLTPPIRSKRDVDNRNETTWESQIEFKVRTPSTEETTSSRNGGTSTIIFSKEFFMITSLFMVCLIAISVLLIIYFRKKYSI